MVPDYSRLQVVAYEEMRGSSAWHYGGNALVLHSRYWFCDDPNDLRPILNPSLSFTAPEDGFLIFSVVHNGTYGKSVTCQTFTVYNSAMSFVLFNSSAYVYDSGIGYCSRSGIVPVAKGDTFYYSIDCRTHDIPNGYRIWFAPVLKK